MASLCNSDMTKASFPKKDASYFYEQQTIVYPTQTGDYIISKRHVLKPQALFCNSLARNHNIVLYSYSSPTFTVGKCGFSTKKIINRKITYQSCELDLFWIHSRHCTYVHKAFEQYRDNWIFTLFDFVYTNWLVCDWILRIV